METKNAIDVKDLKISYRCLKSFSIKRSLLKLKKSEVEVFEAVKGVSFSVPEGEIMGIVGKNGSGKSTMLRAIAGIFSPDSGEIDLHGPFRLPVVHRSRVSKSFDWPGEYCPVGDAAGIFRRAGSG